MATTNDITGDKLISKATSEAYASGWDRIFGKKEEVKEQEEKKDDNEEEHPL